MARYLPAVIRAGLVAGVLVLAVCRSPGGPAFPWPSVAGKAANPVDHAEVLPLLGPYVRTDSPVLARRIPRPTRANLDYAAYHANSMLFEPSEDPPTPAVTVDPTGPFGQVFVPGTLTGSLSNCPLTDGESRHPVAFAPMVDFLARRHTDLAAGPETIRAAVAGETWGLPARPGRPFQWIATVFFRRPPGSEPAVWAKVEFSPGSGLFATMPDEDGDGFPEVYGQLRSDRFPAAAIAALEGDYLSRVLDGKEVHAWANELASYWYPSRNTDIVPLGDAVAWPLPSTEPGIVEALSGKTVANPTVVIRGKPQGKPVYNVFVVDGVAPLTGRGKARAENQSEPTATELPKAFPLSAQPASTVAHIAEELRAHGGAWDAWANEVAHFRQAITRKLSERPKNLQAFIGTDGFLFFRRSMEFVVGGDIQVQPAGKNPFRAIVEFKDYLAKLGVDFLVVPVPSKEEIYPDKLSVPGVTPSRLPVLNPYARKFLGELSQAGVEVVDLLPRYLAEREVDKPMADLIYQRQDTHWTDRGLGIAAREIGARIKEYPWFSQVAATPVAYTFKNCRFKRPGDLHSRLAPAEQRAFRPEALVSRQVLTPKGEVFEDEADSPIVILGDSFTGVFQRTDCLGAGVSAHIAAAISHPVDLVMSYGGGPNVRNTLLTRSEAQLRRMRLVVWIFADRDLFNYWDDWDPLVPAKP